MRQGALGGGGRHRPVQQILVHLHLPEVGLPATTSAHDKSAMRPADVSKVAPECTNSHAIATRQTKIASHFGHVGVTSRLLALTILVGTCSLKGAQHARDRKTAT